MPSPRGICRHLVPSPPCGIVMPCRRWVWPSTAFPTYKLTPFSSGIAFPQLATVATIAAVVLSMRDFARLTIAYRGLRR
eukprot:scaffold21780_cov132-Isochrysis_galbana.AAC.1